MSQNLINRVWQLLLILAMFAFSWLGLQAAHESGHVLHAWASGGTVTRVVLRPTTLSYTLVSPNPRPAFVAWGGPIWGCLFPLILWAAVRAAASRYAFLARFFAGSCLVANGVYLGASVLVGGSELDGPVILANGGAIWPLPLFSLAAIALGVVAWNGLGPNFGLGDSKGNVDRRAAILAAALLGLTLLAECLAP
ncbi:MAG TPA: hypothetical protein VJL29_04905 [Thermoguttaceae bacterium]|nr:hypothetical protein [Thermoguttaceae bacterium]